MEEDIQNYLPKLSWSEGHPLRKNTYFSSSKIKEVEYNFAWALFRGVFRGEWGLSPLPWTSELNWIHGVFRSQRVLSSPAGTNSWIRPFLHFYTTNSKKFLKSIFIDINYFQSNPIFCLKKIHTSSTFQFICNLHPSKSTFIYSETN